MLWLIFHEIKKNIAYLDFQISFAFVHFISAGNPLSHHLTTHHPFTTRQNFLKIPLMFLYFGFYSYLFLMICFFGLYRVSGKKYPYNWITFKHTSFIQLVKSLVYRAWGSDATHAKQVLRHYANGSSKVIMDYFCYHQLFIRLFIFILVYINISL